MHWVPNLQLVRGPVTTFNAFIYCHFEKMKKKFMLSLTNSKKIKFTTLFKKGFIQDNFLRTLFSVFLKLI